jgi:hypothetical protein
MPWQLALIELGKSVVGPLIGAAIAIYSMQRSRKEVISASIIWDWGGPGYDRDAEEPVLHIHNRSPISVMVASVELRRGLLFRRRVENPLYWFDEPAFHFPYKIEAGEKWSHRLDKRSIEREAANAGPFAKAVGYVRFPYLVIVAATVAGTKLAIDAADATPFENRPRWLQR